MTRDKKQTPTDHKRGDGVQGEGNYEAARRYNEETREFVERENVERAAHEADPANASEERELEDAEERGRERAKEEDRLLEHPEKIKPEDSSPAQRKKPR